MSTAKPDVPSVDARTQGGIIVRFRHRESIRDEILLKILREVGGRRLRRTGRKSHTMRTNNVAVCGVSGVACLVAAVENIPSVGHNPIGGAR